MAALDFPDNPTTGQVFDKWTWNGTMWVLTAGGSGAGSGFTFMQDAMPTATALKQTWFETDTGASYVWTDDGNSTQWVQYAPGGGSSDGGGSGFTFVSDTKPTAAKIGDTWFDTSTAATGGTSWVAIEEGLIGSELIWVQFAPGVGASLSPWNTAWGLLSVIDMVGSSNNGGTANETAMMYSNSFTSPPGRRLRVSVMTQISADNPGVYHTLKIRRGAGITGAIVGTQGIHIQAGVSYQTPIYLDYLDLSSGGATQYAFTIQRMHGTGSMTVYGTANSTTSQIRVEDIGPEVRT